MTEKTEELPCASLIAGEINGLYGDVCRNAYLCRITGEPCIARDLDEKTDNLYRYGKASIEPEELTACPAWNIPKDLEKKLISIRREREKSELLKKFEEEDKN